MADGLGAMRCRAGDRVGVRIRSGTTELSRPILGVLVSGAAYVPVDADDPDERARTVFREADVAAVIGDELDIVPSALALRAPRVPRRLGCPGRGAARADGAASVRRRLDHLHLRLDGTAQRRRRVASLGRRLRRRRVPAVPPGSADRGRGPRHGRAVSGLRRLMRGDVAGLALRRVPGAGAAVSGAQRDGPRPVAVANGITVVSTVPTLVALWPTHALDRRAPARPRRRGLPAGDRHTAGRRRSGGLEHLRPDGGDGGGLRGQAHRHGAGANRPAARRVGPGGRRWRREPCVPGRDWGADHRRHWSGPLPRPGQGRREVCSDARPRVGPRVPQRRPGSL